MHLAPDTSKVHPVTLMPIEVYWCPKPGPVLTMRMSKKQSAQRSQSAMNTQVYEQQAEDTCAHHGKQFHGPCNMEKSNIVTYKDFPTRLAMVRASAGAAAGASAASPSASPKSFSWQSWGHRQLQLRQAEAQSHGPRSRAAEQRPGLLSIQSSLPASVLSELNRSSHHLAQHQCRSLGPKPVQVSVP